MEARASDIKANVTIYFDLVHKVVINIKGFLKIPKITTEEVIDFKIKQFHHSYTKYLTLINPSDKYLQFQIFMGNYEISSM